MINDDAEYDYVLYFIWFNLHMIYNVVGRQSGQGRTRPTNFDVEAWAQSLILYWLNHSGQALVHRP